MTIHSLFLTFAGAAGVLIGLLAFFRPETVLAGKGVDAGAATAVWVRQLGASILALSIMLLGVRNHPDSPSVRAILGGNALLHGMMFPIEIRAYQRGIITKLSGIVPNSILHAVFACTFAVLTLFP